MSAYWHPTRPHTATCVQKINEKESRILRKSIAEAGHWTIAWSSLTDDDSYEKNTFYNTL